MPKDEWDARLLPETRPRTRGGRRQGLLLILIAIGIPAIVFFFQDNGALRFYSSENVSERTLSPKEKQEIREAVDRYKAKLDAVGRIVEDVKERYRNATGEGYTSERWVFHNVEGFAIPFKYFLALGGLIGLIGLGKLIL